MTDENPFPPKETTLAGDMDPALQKHGPAQAELQEKIPEFERFNRLVMAGEQIHSGKP
jgi:hypothetical protein